jgi:hypothetical protein
MNRAFRLLGLMMNLDARVMLQTFTRFDIDPEFRRRHGGWFYTFFLFLTFNTFLYLV